MPLRHFGRLSSHIRTPSANRQLAGYLAFVAGATNAGGFLAARQYTSHMTGIVSAMADNLALGSFALALGGLAAVVSFLSGAVTTTILIRWAREHSPKSQYALPLALESGLLIMFGVTGKTFAGERLLGTVVLLCFTMGLQNAMITKLSDAVIRTTHLTGMVTDIGIELGRMLISDRGGDLSKTADPGKVVLLFSLISLFFVGGVIGAVGLKHVGFLFTLPLAGILLLIASMPVLEVIRSA
jgi:uncharacterized membrane protein YoaK (UPF0700 family)